MQSETYNFSILSLPPSPLPHCSVLQHVGVGCRSGQCCVSTPAVEKSSLLPPAPISRTHHPHSLVPVGPALPSVIGTHQDGRRYTTVMHDTALQKYILYFPLTIRTHTQCSNSCGIGVQRRHYRCRYNAMDKFANKSCCAALPVPEQMQECVGVLKCTELKWVVTPWEEVRSLLILRHWVK